MQASSTAEESATKLPKTAAAGTAVPRKVIHIQASSAAERQPAAPTASHAAADAAAMEVRMHARELLWWSCYTLLGYAYIGMPRCPLITAPPCADMYVKRPA